MTTPTVSVVTGTYNPERYIRETLDSLFAQTYQDFESIVVDDASTDGTVDLIRRTYGDRVRLFQAVYDELLDPAKPAMKAMLQLAETFQHKEVAISSGEFKELVDGTYLNPVKLGTWHDGIPAQIRQAVAQAVTAPAAPAAAD